MSSKNVYLPSQTPERRGCGCALETRDGSHRQQIAAEQQLCETVAGATLTKDMLIDGRDSSLGLTETHSGVKLNMIYNLLSTFSVPKKPKSAAGAFDEAKNPRCACKNIRDIFKVVFGTRFDCNADDAILK